MKSVTPQELLCSSINTFPVDELFKATITDSAGNIYPMFTADEIEARRKFPNFAISFSLFTQLWKDIPEPRRGRMFEKMEGLIKNIRVMDSIDDWRACPQVAKKWYMGQLDEKEQEENDEKFYEWIISHIEV